MASCKLSGKTLRFLQSQILIVSRDEMLANPSAIDSSFEHRRTIRYLRALDRLRLDDKKESFELFLTLICSSVAGSFLTIGM